MLPHQMSDPKNASRGSSSCPRKPYSKPQLTVFGGLFQVTRASAGTCSDNDNGFQHRPTAEHQRCVDINGNTFFYVP